MCLQCGKHFKKTSLTHKTRDELLLEKEISFRKKVCKELIIFFFIYLLKYIIIITYYIY